MEQHVFTLVLDLNETLIYSDWKVRRSLETSSFVLILQFWIIQDSLKQERSYKCLHQFVSYQKWGYQSKSFLYKMIFLYAYLFPTFKRVHLLTAITTQLVTGFRMWKIFFWSCLILVMGFSFWCLKRDRGWRTFKRPGVDAFLEHLAKFYEIVVYSDQLSMVILISFLTFMSLVLVLPTKFKMLCLSSVHAQYVDPVVERLDKKQCIRYRLSRAATRYQDGKHYRVCANH